MTPIPLAQDSGFQIAYSSSMRKLANGLSAFDSASKCLNVIVETPKGSRHKYAYLPEAKLLELKRALPAGLVFPFNFGAIPSTLAPDGDPLDILILNQEPLTPGCLVKARLLGVLEAEQTEGGQTTRNDRLIGVAVTEQAPSELEGIELDKRVLAQIKHFFVSYNELNGKKFKILGKAGPKKAKAWSEKPAVNMKKRQESIVSSMCAASKV